MDTSGGLTGITDIPPTVISSKYLSCGNPAPTTDISSPGYPRSGSKSILDSETAGVGTVGTAVGSETTLGIGTGVASIGTGVLAAGGVGLGVCSAWTIKVGGILLVLPRVVIVGVEIAEDLSTTEPVVFKFEPSEFSEIESPTKRANTLNPLVFAEAVLPFSSTSVTKGSHPL